MSASRIRKSGYLLLAAWVAGLVAFDLYQYGTRCEFSPPVSALGLCVALAFQATSLLFLASIVEKVDPQSTTKRLRIGQALVAPVILTVLGAAFAAAALTASDVVAIRGAHSSGERCSRPGP